MNASVYLFGEFNSGYSQYPDDYAAEIFKKFSANAKSTTQIAIHRDGNLMYYGYVRKLQSERYIGLCVVLNGLILTRLDSLFSLFEGTIANLVTKGMLIHFDQQGELVTSVEKLYLNREQIDLVTESLRAGFGKLETYCKPLPPDSFATAKDSQKDFLVDAPHDDIIKSSYTNGYTYIYKSAGYETAEINSYKGVLAQSHKEKKELQEKYDALQQEHASTLKKKKQMSVVITLITVLSVLSIIFFVVFFVLLGTQNELEAANGTISEQNNTLNNQSAQISNLNDQNAALEDRRQAEQNMRMEAENNLQMLQSTISDRQPFIIKQTSFDFYTGYLTFDYYGIVNDTIDVIVRAYNNEGDNYSNTASMIVVQGDNTQQVYLNDELDNQKWYSFEILKGNVILGGDRH